MHEVPMASTPDSPATSRMRPFGLRAAALAQAGGLAAEGPRRDDTDGWAGIYRDAVFGSQARAGLDTTINATDHIQLQPSLQIATTSSTSRTSQ